MLCKKKTKTRDVGHVTHTEMSRQSSDFITLTFFANEALVAVIMNLIKFVCTEFCDNCNCIVECFLSMHALSSEINSLFVFFMAGVIVCGRYFSLYYCRQTVLVLLLLKSMF